VYISMKIRSLQSLKSHKTVELKALAKLRNVFVPVFVYCIRESQSFASRRDPIRPLEMRNEGYLSTLDQLPIDRGKEGKRLETV
ncbi:hypothetical protein PFISCL1PPCAC_9703, partial [Pristionchus fissidentatus]